MQSSFCKYSFGSKPRQSGVSSTGGLQHGVHWQTNTGHPHKDVLFNIPVISPKHCYYDIYLTEGRKKKKYGQITRQDVHLPETERETAPGAERDEPRTRKIFPRKKN